MKLPDFFSITWVSPAAQAHWEPIIQNINTFWMHLEKLTVAQSFRDFAVQFVEPKDFVKFARECMSLGLKFMPIEFDGTKHRVVVYKDDVGDIDEFFIAWTKGDIPEIGRLLGYPGCCLEWFDILWRVEQKTDTCLAQAGGVELVGEDPDSNILLRDLGVRPVFHLPHSLSCPSTHWIARELKHLAKQSNIGKMRMQEIYHILRWPVKYSALHGIAEITTPVFKLRRATDYTAQNKKVLYQGTEYPEHGASGLSFPFQKQSFIPIRHVDRWTDNGFSSNEAMQSGHSLILSRLRALHGAFDTFSLIDLGCGNGELLRSIRQTFTNAKVHGIDLSPAKIERAKRRVPDATLQVGDVTRMEWDETYDVVLVAMQRLDEAKSSGIEHFSDRIVALGKTILFYNYNMMNVDVINAKDQTSSSSLAPSSEASPIGDGGSGTAHDGDGRSEDGRGSASLILDRANQTREEGH